MVPGCIAVTLGSDFVVEADIDSGSRLQRTASRDIIYTSFRDGFDRVETDAAGCFELGPTCDGRYCRLHVRYAHVVEHDYVCARIESLGNLFQAIALHLDLDKGRSLRLCDANGVGDAAANRDVVILEHHTTIESQAT